MTVMHDALALVAYGMLGGFMGGLVGGLAAFAWIASGWGEP